MLPIQDNNKLKIIVWLLIKMLQNKKLNAISLDYTRNALSKQIFARYEGIVQEGLFKGLQVREIGFWDGGGDAGAKILGIYEQQVLETFTEKQKFRTLINIGAADGYYGFGLLLAKKCKNVIFFESSLESRNEIEKMNQLYDFQIEILEKATRETLTSVIEKTKMDEVVFLVDIEGGEFIIFDNNLIEKMQGSTIILEIHDFVNPNFDKHALEQKFSGKFDIEKIFNNSRKLPQLEAIQDLHDNERWLLASEGRVKGMEWWILSTKKDRENAS
jgi:hypothetical protein